MKISRLIFAFWLLSGSLVFSQLPQSQVPRGRGSEKMIEELKKNLDLTNEQVTKVKTIFSEMESKREQMRDSNLSLKEVQKKMEAQRDRNDKAIMAILTKEQQEKFKEFQKEREKRIQSTRGKKLPEGGPEN